MKLAEPDVDSKQVASTDDDGEPLKVKITDNPDLPDQEQDWDATRTHLVWDSVECTNLYTLNLTGKLTEDTTGEPDMNAEVRVIEKKDSEGKQITEVQQYAYVEVEKATATSQAKWEWRWKSVDEVKKDYPEGTEETDKIHTYKLDEYQVNIASTYGDSQKAYKLTIMAELDVQLKEDGGFHYVLKLPDISDVKAKDNGQEITVTHDNFKVTTSVTFTSNVTDNLDGNTSDAYIKSEENEVKFTN